MRTLGIVGGIGPESTIDYYRRIIAGYRARQPDDSYPHILINSIDVGKLLALAAASDLSAMTDYLSREVTTLTRAGADVALFASNTPHLVFDAVQERSSIPLISIVDSTCATLLAGGLRRVGLLGTRFTMQSDFYAKVLGRHGIAVVLPEAGEQALIHSSYVGELVEGVFLAETRDRFLSIIETLGRREGLDAVVLAGTELPLLLRTASVGAVPLLDTASIHANAAVERLLD